MEDYFNYSPLGTLINVHLCSLYVAFPKEYKSGRDGGGRFFVTLRLPKRSDSSLQGFRDVEESSFLCIHVSTVHNTRRGPVRTSH